MVFGKKKVNYVRNLQKIIYEKNRFSWTLFALVQGTLECKVNMNRR